MSEHKKKYSILEPKGYAKAFDEFIEKTREATEDEKEYGHYVAQFITNAFVHVTRHLISMSIYPEDSVIQDIEGDTKGRKELAKGGMLVGYFVAFLYELISPAIELQKENSLMRIDITKFARRLGIIDGNEEFKVGAPEEAGQGVCVPVAVCDKKNKKGFDLDDMDIEDIFNGEDGEKMKNELIRLLSEQKIHGGSA